MFPMLRILELEKEIHIKEQEVKEKEQIYLQALQELEYLQTELEGWQEIEDHKTLKKQK